MASLKKLLAHNMKEQRRFLGISQAKLAEWINTSTHYIAMIELELKTPSLLMVERIAAALKVDPAELFSVRNVPPESLKKLQKSILADIEKAVCNVVTEKIKNIDKEVGPVWTAALQLSSCLYLAGLLCLAPELFHRGAHILVCLKTF
jgi:transcriptional regulator with XRE-family HTH domain